MSVSFFLSLLSAEKHPHSVTAAITPPDATMTSFHLSFESYYYVIAYINLCFGQTSYLKGVVALRGSTCHLQRWSGGVD